jgi:hypothetical protein
MLNNIFDQYNLPEVAHDALSRRNLTAQNLGGGIERIVEHDAKGLPFRFEIHTQYNPLKSKQLKYEYYDELEIIRWFRDRFDQPVELVRLLPEALLDLSDTEAPRGLYAEAYKRFKEGRAAPGTPLSKWGVLTDGQVSTLAHKGIFSIEQFAATPKGKVVSMLPSEYVEAWERAHQFMAAKDNRAVLAKNDEEIKKLADANAELKKQLIEMQQKLMQFLERQETQGFNAPVGLVQKEASEGPAIDEAFDESLASTVFSEGESEEPVIKRGRGRPKGSTAVKV